MKREIKFRAWAGEKMLSGQDMMNKTVGQLQTWSDRVMQFTGIHDKNGKEVFEGDVISIENESYDEPTTQEVKWDKDGGGYFFDEDYGMDYRAPITDDNFSIEVIGNIHQNADLLEPKTPAR